MVLYIIVIILEIFKQIIFEPESCYVAQFELELAMNPVSLILTIVLLPPKHAQESSIL